MSRLVLRSNGVVDKFIGDAIVAFWNAPKPVRDHPNVACHTALMSLQRLKLLQRGTFLVNRYSFGGERWLRRAIDESLAICIGIGGRTGWTQRGFPTISIRIGLATGIALVGNLGSPERLRLVSIPA